jgi:hypothetical protein
MRALVIGFVSILAACGGDDTTPAQHDAAVDSKAIDAPKVFMDAPPGTATLTVKNYLDWCEVGIDGATPVHAATVTANLAPGTYNVVAKGATGFEIQPGMWHHVDGSTGNTGVDGTQVGGASGTSTAMVTMTTAAKCVWVCCAFASDGHGCESTIPDQCP